MVSGCWLCRSTAHNLFSKAGPAWMRASVAYCPALWRCNCLSPFSLIAANEGRTNKPSILSGGSLSATDTARWSKNIWAGLRHLRRIGTRNMVLESKGRGGLFTRRSTTKAVEKAKRGRKKADYGHGVIQQKDGAHMYALTYRHVLAHTSTSH